VAAWNGCGKKFTKTKKMLQFQKSCVKTMLIISFTQMVSTIENSLERTKPLMQCVRGTLWKGCEEV
jgi:hypothetical protein